MWEHETANLPPDEDVPKFDYEIPKRLSDCYLLGSLTGFLGKSNTRVPYIYLYLKNYQSLSFILVVKPNTRRKANLVTILANGKKTMEEVST